MEETTPSASGPAMNRRSVVVAAAAVPASLAAQCAAEASHRRRRRSRRLRRRLDAAAGHWQTWLVPNTSRLIPPKPPANHSSRTAAELEELRSLQAAGNGNGGSLVDFWDELGGIPVWTQALLDSIKESSTNPVMAARALALVHCAMADAAIVSWFARFRWGRPAPARLDRRIRPAGETDPQLPSYPSEHAAIAGAAAMVLSYLYPTRTVLFHGARMGYDEAGREAALSRLMAGTSYRSDVEAGWLLGQNIGALAVLRGQTDGSAAVWDTVTRPGQPAPPAMGPNPYWQPTPPAFAANPLLPLAGLWRTWLLQGGAEFRSAPPPGLRPGELFPTQEFLDATAEVKSIVDRNDPNERRIAFFWADGAGTVTPPGHWTQFARDHVMDSDLSVPAAARLMALQGAGVSDSAVACWETKYFHWLLRPVTAIRTLAGQPFHDPAWTSPVATPPFPAYTSGHSTFSGCSARILEAVFPGGRVEDAFGSLIPFEEASDQAAVSRLYGGIHYRFDNDEGLAMGRRIADRALERLRRDGPA